MILEEIATGSHRPGGKIGKSADGCCRFEIIKLVGDGSGALKQI
jgi:hypothetical protein